MRAFMKSIFTLLFLLFFWVPETHAQEDAYTYMDTDEEPGVELEISPEELEEVLEPSPEEDDPLETLNRGTFALNNFLDEILFDHIAAMYNGVVPEFFRERVGYFLRNLSEPIVLANNILQGEMQDAEDTLRRFAINTTAGIGGIFDVSTDLDIPYKREDFGLTLASWGFDSGPYLVLPILGPSNLRDTIGRIGDYGFDPVNWWAFFDDNKAIYSYTRTGVQILDAKADNLGIIGDLKRNSVDPYATFRAWYTERRKSLSARDEKRTLETAKPDEEDDDDL
ncbi:MAG: hypothetical protein A2W62_02710 [Alphaproteobacteria bacterium RIFCSPLOWO2_02_42_7]|nr:MAG: hypothetical protein A2W62_02710 [Alphaproteobacteria bacterium RIFCSPLOWO2_02_42_7]